MPAMTPTPTAHILLDERGRAWIDDTNVKVIEVVLDKLGYGWTADQIHEGHDGYLSRAQIHAALSYYCDHQEEFDAEMERQHQEYLRLWAENRDSPIQQKLRRLGKIP
jgi:uncharacterized protein (DUF433 family)